ncbi:MAG: ECF-type sigma factor [Rubricoccaceae bacterium]|nr:ECF-type sigma factor [Rubricoccaceae bacterium]
MVSPSDTTRLLLDARNGDREALDALWPHVYEELRLLARARLRAHRPGDTLDTTALVHEAYLRLVDGARAGWESRAHFFALAARAMRFILVDYARERAAQKRGGPRGDLRLDGLQVADDPAVAERAADLLTLDAALERLATYDGRLARLVEYRFFGGLTYEEVAEVAGCSVPTAKRDWQRARTWLFRAMKDDDLAA